jgi:cytochrome c biogenesis protein CcmG/thiol:disulfide interchange protein DsbE
MYDFPVKRLGFAIALLALLVGCYGGTRPPRIGEAAPDFTLKDPTGSVPVGDVQGKVALAAEAGPRTVSLHDLKGQVVVLNFWATWCPPCVEEMPSLVEMQKELKARGVTVLAVSVDVDSAAFHRFLAQHKVDLLAVRDPDQKSNTIYGTYKFPETYIIDRQGMIRRKFIGPVDWTQPEIVSYLSSL